MTKDERDALWRCLSDKAKAGARDDYAKLQATLQAGRLTNYEHGQLSLLTWMFGEDNLASAEDGGRAAGSGGTATDCTGSYGIAGPHDGGYLLRQEPDKR